MITITQSQLDELNPKVRKELDRQSGGNAATFFAEQIDRLVVLPLASRIEQAVKQDVADLFVKADASTQEQVRAALGISAKDPASGTFKAVVEKIK